MKRRRRGGGAAPQAEACGVWLDAEQLKQRPAQSLIVKPKVSSRILERKLISVACTGTRAAQPRTKQTTISTFFCPQTDDKYKENSRPSSLTPNENSKEKGTALSASSVKILPLPQKRSFGAGEETAPASWLLRAESPSTSGLGEDCSFFSFTQNSEGNRLIARRPESKVFAGETVSARGSLASGCGTDKWEARPLSEEAKSGLDCQARRGANESQKPHDSSRVNSLIDFSEIENINPALTRGSPRPADFYSSPQRPAQPLRERSQNAGAGSAAELRGGKEGAGSPCRQLFTQDSEGNRVIAHRCRNGPSPGRDRGSSRGQLPGSPGKGGSLSQFSLCCDLLFTQDSEGNRVIKH